MQAAVFREPADEIGFHSELASLHQQGGVHLVPQRLRLRGRSRGRVPARRSGTRRRRWGRASAIRLSDSPGDRRRDLGFHAGLRHGELAPQRGILTADGSVALQAAALLTQRHAALRGREIRVDAEHGLHVDFPACGEVVRGRRSRRRRRLRAPSFRSLDERLRLRGARRTRRGEGRGLRGLGRGVKPLL